MSSGKYRTDDAHKNIHTLQLLSMRAVYIVHVHASTSAHISVRKRMFARAQTHAQTPTVRLGGGSGCCGHT